MSEEPILGFDQTGEGPLLVLIHGFPFDRRMWVHQLEGLAGLRRVIAVDLPGRGASLDLPTEGASMDRYADLVAATIAAQALDRSPGQADQPPEPADVVGLSMGGYVAFALWRRHPELIRSLVLTGTRAGADSAEAKAARTANAALVQAEGTIGLAEAMVPKLLAPGARNEVRARVLTMFADTPAATAMADLLALRDRPDSTPTLGGITVPTLIVRGDQDALMTPAETELLVGAIPGAVSATVPDGGHLSPLENPDDFNRAVRAFLSR